MAPLVGLFFVVGFNFFSLLFFAFIAKTFHLWGVIKTLESKRQGLTAAGFFGGH